MTTDTGLLRPEGIRLAQTASSKEEAIDQVGRVLVEIGAVAEPYVAAMREREELVSTFVGEGVAIPHGTDASRVHVKHTALSVVQFPEGVDWGGNQVHLCVGIAAQGSEQVGILSALAQVLMDGESAAELRQAADAETIIRILTSGQDEDEETVQ